MVLINMWILPEEERREAWAKPGWLLLAHCKMHMSAFAKVAPSWYGSTAIGKKKNKIK